MQVLQKTDVLVKAQWACLYPSLLNKQYLPTQREIQPDEQRAGLMKLQKKPLEKKKNPLFKG